MEACSASPGIQPCIGIGGVEPQSGLHPGAHQRNSTEDRDAIGEPEAQAEEPGPDSACASVRQRA